jgi:hypothetical protein
MVTTEIYGVYKTRIQGPLLQSLPHMSFIHFNSYEGLHYSGHDLKFLVGRNIPQSV